MAERSWHLTESCGGCGAEIGEECRIHCTGLQAQLNGIEDATNAQEEQ